MRANPYFQFPWAHPELYSVHERNKIFSTLRHMIEALVERLKSQKVCGLEDRLVSALVHAGLRCPAFNPRMKFCLAYVGKEKQILEKMSEEMLLFFPFDTLTWLPPYETVVLEVSIFWSYFPLIL